MAIIDIQNVSKSMGDKPLFKDINFTVNKGDKVALIGKNGCGKSTLLKIIANIVDKDGGDIVFEKGTITSMLSQNQDYDLESTIFQHLFNGEYGIHTVIKEYEIECEKIGTDEENQKKIELLSNKIDSLDGWQYEHKLKALLDKLQITDLNKKIKELSGGMVKKVALAEALLKRSDILILDEPTNHLDIDTISWLEEYIKNEVSTILIVTHDRYFLNNVCNKLIELDDLKITEYKGNYGYYLEKKSELDEHRERKNKRIKSLLREEYKWLSKSPQGRGTKQKARVSRVSETENKIVIKEDETLSIGVKSRRQGKKILEIEDVSKSFENNLLFENFSYLFSKNERIGIVGENGAGKSTILNILTGGLSPDSGKVDIGKNTFFGYFSQFSNKLPMDEKVHKFIKDNSEMIELSDGNVITASDMLEKFLFPKELHYTDIGDLSGGERRRLFLLSVLLQNPNFIILDEPTNDFDIATLTILEDYLLHFDGTVIIVSHDRYFIDRLATSLFVIENKKVIHYSGNYNDYLISRAEKKKAQKKRVSEQKEDIVKQKREKVKLSYKEKLEFEKIEPEIEELEDRISELELELSLNISNADKLMEISKEYEQKKIYLDEKIKRWEFLAEYDL